MKWLEQLSPIVAFVSQFSIGKYVWSSPHLLSQFHQPTNQCPNTSLLHPIWVTLTKTMCKGETTRFGLVLQKACLSTFVHELSNGIGHAHLIKYAENITIRWKELTHKSLYYFWEA